MFRKLGRFKFFKFDFCSWTISQALTVHFTISIIHIRNPRFISFQKIYDKIIFNQLEIFNLITGKKLEITILHDM